MAIASPSIHGCRAPAKEGDRLSDAHHKFKQHAWRILGLFALSTATGSLVVSAGENGKTDLLGDLDLGVTGHEMLPPHVSALRYRIEPGGNCLVRIEGTSLMGNWQVESRMIEGYIDLGPDSITSAHKARMERIPVKAELRIPVRSLKSVDARGKPMSAVMDDVMYRALRETNNHEIVYTLTEVASKESPDGSASWWLDTKGNLVVSGIEKGVTMSVEIVVADGELRFRTETKLKMSDFNIDPPLAKTVDGLLKLADDDVTVSIDGTATTVRDVSMSGQPVAPDIWRPVDLDERLTFHRVSALAAAAPTLFSCASCVAK